MIVYSRGKAKKAESVSWDDLSKSNRDADPSKPNRLEQPPEWWRKAEGTPFPYDAPTGQNLFTESMRGGDKNPTSKYYRFLAKAYEQEKYSFLQRQAPDASLKKNQASIEFSQSLVEDHKRSFAIEPHYVNGDLAFEEQKDLRKDKSARYSGTFPDLVVQKDNRTIAIEAKVPGRSQSKKESVKEEYFRGFLNKQYFQDNKDPFFQTEFENRKKHMPDDTEQRLVIDLRNPAINVANALGIVRDEYRNNKDKFKFDSIQFVSESGSRPFLSAVYSTSSGFTERYVHPEKVKQADQVTVASSMQPFHSARTTSIEEDASSARHAPPISSKRKEVSESLKPANSQKSAQPSKRAKTESEQVVSAPQAQLAVRGGSLVGYDPVTKRVTYPATGRQASTSTQTYKPTTNSGQSISRGWQAKYE